MLGSAGSAGVESWDDADGTCALMRSTTLRWEPGDAVASGDEDSDAAGDWRRCDLRASDADGVLHMSAPSANTQIRLMNQWAHARP